MDDTITINVPRPKAELALKQFITKKGKSGLVYLRGRRRVGKTTLLKKLQAESLNIFYFIGVADEPNKSSLIRFAKSWDDFTGKPTLTKFKNTELDWSLCFDNVSSYAANNPSKLLTIIFDEIQWIAKSRSGFVGTVKDKWIDWEKTNNIKLIICGSSNRFFIKQTGGEEKILRGLKTNADIVLAPLTAQEVREHYFPDWGVDEVLMLYMMIGGIPYYLNQVSRRVGFVRAANEAFFTRSTIFLAEVDEVLNVEFNRAGIVTTKKILATLGVLGGTFAVVADKLEMAASGIFEAVGKLVDYSLLKEKKCIPLKNRKKVSTVYFYDDPYLLFYFACLEPMRTSIKENDRQLLISNLIGSEKSLYIANFSGRAFEVYIRNLLSADLTEQQNVFLDLMGVVDRDYELYDSLANEPHGDLILLHKKLRTYFVIECKWTKHLDVVKEGIEQALKFQAPDNLFPVERIVITNCNVGEGLVKKSREQGVRLITTGEMFF